ncbi:Response regulator receiver protein [Burkholderia sp. 8Y]|uniref:response regulator n=1 Tax=Burkholderia sp. 8Y TaxID=2653133 RepID=UPI0012F31C0B|nr:response regulator [Burkholderia sp. 8Y]VXB21300.1 Response regulator receiver protein [Burkholderia sp. 8Y]
MPVNLHSPRCALWTNRSIDVDLPCWRILVVDDNASSAEALAAALAADGFETRIALSGVDALHAVDGWVPHIVILDISMPEHDGFATARVLRRIARTRDAGIVAFTALGEELVRTQGLHAGFDGYCQKGNSPATLVHLMQRLVH